MQTPFIQLRKSVLNFVGSDILIAICILLLGLVLLYNSLSNRSESIIFILLCALILICTAIFSIVFIYKFYKNEQVHALDLLQKKSNRIVWCYYTRMHIMPFGIGLFIRCRFFIYTLNGDAYTLRAGEKSIQTMISHLKHLHPGITIGYSINNEQLFKADPHLLRND